MNPILKWTVVAGVLALVLGHVQALKAQIVAPPAGDKWVSTYDDEFNEGSLDLAGWSYSLVDDVGQLQQNTNSPSNCYVSGGNLNVVAIASGTGANETYTAASIRSSGLFAQTYGLIEFTAKMPVGTGLWPGVGMFPENPTNPTGVGNTAYGNWPNSGEIDIDESPNLSPNSLYPDGTDNNLVHAALHYEGSSGAAQQQAIYSVPAGFTTADWHTYDVEWNAPSGSTPGSINWYCDGNEYFSTNSWPGPETAGGDNEAPFDQPFYLNIALAVGGDFGGTIVPDLADGDYDYQIGYIREFEPTSVGAALAVTIPEPASSTIFLVAAAGLLLNRRRRMAKGT